MRRYNNFVWNFDISQFYIISLWLKKLNCFLLEKSSIFQINKFEIFKNH